jgi:dTDP-4-dehydrorhamnose reductase
MATDAECDVSSADAVAWFASACRPDWIVNCAAYTAVDRAEAEEGRAYAVNALGALHLARAVDSCGGRLLHVSTDYVFDGAAAGPYSEDAPVRPIGAYGRSKAAGEAFVREACRRHFIVRTAWLHGPHGSNFVATMLRLMGQGRELRVVGDQRGCPTYASDLAAALLRFVESGTERFGTFHYTNQGECTWHDFAVEIREQAVARGLLRTSPPIERVPTSEYPTAARRPANSVLSSARIQDVLGLSIPAWQDGLQRHLERLEERRPERAGTPS